MNLKVHLIAAATSTVLFAASLPSTLAVASPSVITKSDICKAGVATVMGRDPSIMRIDKDSEGILYLSYVRSDDGSLWSYKCKVEGSLIIWASDTGRWRDHPADSRVTYRIQADTIHVEEEYSDGSAKKKSYRLDQLRN